MQRSAVDLPAPFGPRNPKISPAATENETFSMPRLLPYRLVMRSTTTGSAERSIADRAWFTLDQASVMRSLMVPALVEVTVKVASPPFGDETTHSTFARESMG